MNTSKMMSLLASAALAATFATAGAAEAGGTDTLAMPMTRAEVLADLQIWRESGLAAVQTLESPDFASTGYLQAQQRYERLRASPQFAALVERIARERGETVLTAKH